MKINTNGALRALAVVALLIGFLVPVASCKGESNKFKQPKFVKEWEVKEFVPGASHRVLDITANKYGVFALVEAEELKTLYPKKWSDLTKDERKKAIDEVKSVSGAEKVDEEKYKKCEGFLVRTVIRYTYQIQHFDHNGNFVKSWPENNRLDYSGIKNNTEQNLTSFKEWLEDYHDIDSRSRFIKPLRIVSSEDGHIYVADFEGNKLAMFDHDGTLLNTIKINRQRRFRYDHQANCRGMAYRDNILKLAYQPDSGTEIFNILTYDALSGKTTDDVEYSVPEQIPFIDPLIKKGLNINIPLISSPAFVDDVAMDKKGNIYLLAGMQRIFKYDAKMRKILSFDVVLKEGFDTSFDIIDPVTDKKYGREYTSLTGGFDSRKGASFGQDMGGPGFYDLDRVFVTPDDRLMVTFKGNKPFGVMVAVVYDLDGKQIGYWKADKKTGANWFNEYAPILKVKAIEETNCLAFIQNAVFVGKSIHGHGLIHKYSVN